MKRYLLILLAIGIAVLTSTLVVQDFSVPLSGPLGGDTDFWEYMGYYVHRNISFFDAKHFFLPHLDYTNNQHLYPFGTNHVLQGWAIEPSLWYALCYSIFGGWGNWLGYYYVMSHVLVFLGTWSILKKEIGFSKGIFAATLVTLFNFYALQRFPDHYSHTIHHWLTLNIILDFVLFKRFYEGNSISSTQILLKILLLILSLGLEIGYVAGLTLSSFTITIFSAIVLLIHRKRSISKIYLHFLAISKHYRFSKIKDASNFILSIFILTFSYLYVPIIGQLFFEVKGFPPPDLHGNWWTNPLRIFLPAIIPANLETINSFMKDSTEGLLQGSIGWFLLIFALLGIYKTPKKQRLSYLPLFILLLLCLVYHPRLFPTLRLFPWFEYARVPGRTTIVYPAIAALFAINAAQVPRLFQYKIGYILLFFMGFTELSFNYHFRFQNKPYKFERNFEEYMYHIRDAPGEAVFDFPFCIIGGNGVGRKENLAPLYADNAHVSTMQRFHQKKTVGHYYGRLNETQIESQVRLGWGTLMQTETDNPFMRQKLKSCLTTFQFNQFVKFIKYNNFAGINLYTDLLPENCEAEFVKIFGKPTAETQVPGIGRTIFIPKPTNWFTEIDLEKGKKISFITTELLPSNKKTE